MAATATGRYKGRMHPGDFAAGLRQVRVRRKLSQLELALRARTSQRHLSFLEQGRSTPGRAMVIRLAEALELPLRERNELLTVAGFAGAYPLTDLGDQALAPVAGALGHILAGHLPFPALIIDRHGELLAANAAVEILTEGVAAWLLAPPVNLYRVTLHPEGLAPRIGNLAEWRHRIIARLDEESLRNPDHTLDALLGELRSYTPGTPCEATPNDLGFAVPLRLRTVHGDLRLLTTITTFTGAYDVTLAELKLEAFLPADDAAAVLTRLGAARETGGCPDEPVSLCSRTR